MTHYYTVETELGSDEPDQYLWVFDTLEDRDGYIEQFVNSGDRVFFPFSSEDLIQGAQPPEQEQYSFTLNVRIRDKMDGYTEDGAEAALLDLWQRKFAEFDADITILSVDY